MNNSIEQNQLSNWHSSNRRVCIECTSGRWHLLLHDLKCSNKTLKETTQTFPMLGVRKVMLALCGARIPSAWMIGSLAKIENRVVSVPSITNMVAQKAERL